MITKAVAVQLGSVWGSVTLYHVTVTYSRSEAPYQCRVNGRCQTWKTRPGEWRLPVKHGLKACFDITPRNAAEWMTAEQLGDERCVQLHKAVAARECPVAVLMDYLQEMGCPV